MPRRARTLAPLAAFGLVLLSACGGESAVRGTAAAERPRVVVDSTFPIEEEMRRFLLTVPAEPAALAGTRGSHETLVRDYLAALAAEDTAALRQMTLSRAEFAYFYYPATRFTAPPYELSPALVWYQIQNHGSRGITRALNRYGGQALVYRGHACGAHPVEEGENRIWSGCRVRFEVGGAPVEERIHGPILERDGRVKFVSYANGL